MSKNIDKIAGIVLGINPESLEIPKELRDFLKLDDQGIEGLDFMLKDAKLFRRIPPEVRAQYEILFFTMRTSIEESIKELRQSLDEIESNPKDLIHEFINQAVSDDAD